MSPAAKTLPPNERELTVAVIVMSTGYAAGLQPNPLIIGAGTPGSSSASIEYGVDNESNSTALCTAE